jgi:excisionase family DNA binding protein
VIEKYGGKCVWCGKTGTDKLTMDHVNGGGAEEGCRKAFYKRLLAEPLQPDLYQVLCWECNCTKRDGEYPAFWYEQQWLAGMADEEGHPPEDPGPRVDLLIVGEVADCLRVSSRTVYRLCQEGRLRFVRVGREVRVFAESLDEYVQAQTNAPPPRPRRRSGSATRATGRPCSTSANT